MPSPAIQRATAIVELLQIRSKLSWTRASTTSPDPLVRATVSREHVLGARLQRLAETTEVPCGRLGENGRRYRHPYLIPSQG